MELIGWDNVLEVLRCRCRDFPAYIDALQPLLDFKVLSLVPV
jgi:hypothetical protein